MKLKVFNIPKETSLADAKSIEENKQKQEQQDLNIHQQSKECMHKQKLSFHSLAGFCEEEIFFLFDTVGEEPNKVHKETEG